MKNKINKTLLNIILIIGVTALVLWLVLRDNFSEVAGILNKLDFKWVIAVIIFSLVIQIVIGLIVCILARLTKKDYSLPSGVISAIVASFFHGVTPGSSGGQIAQVYIFKKQGIDITDSASILWLEFILYQASMVLIVFFLILYKLNFLMNELNGMFLLVMIGFLINSFVILGLWLLGHFPKLYRWITTSGVVIGCKLRLIKDKEKTIDNINRQLERFTLEIKRLRGHKKTIIVVMLLNMVRLIAHFSIPLFCMLAINLEVSFEMWLNVLALSSFVTMINAFIPIPGASGGTEVTFVIMFSVLIGSINATSVMILWRFVSYYFILLIGGIAFVVFKFLTQRKEAKLM